MRILHTSDWHLGQHLFDLEREREHAHFLGFLLDSLEAEEIDALLLTGDVFDTGSPPASAQRMYFQFLADLRRRLPALDVVVIAGNHDSPARLDAPAALLAAMKIHVIGALPRSSTGELQPDRLVLPLHAADGSIGAWVAAVPFLRSAELPPCAGEADPLIAGVRAIYDAAFAAARERRAPGQALLATGHAYLAGGQLSELSERKILGGNQHALPADLFPEELAYVALGHLHRSQTVGGRTALHYAGSPLPLSFAEVAYDHQVAVVELDGERLASVRSLPVPRSLELRRIPAGAPVPLAGLLPLLAALPAASTVPEEERPWIEVQVALDAHEPSLRRTIAAALEGKAVRLVNLAAHRTGSGSALGDVAPLRRLDELQVEEVFRKLYARDHEEEAPQELLAALHELVEEVEAARGEEGGP